MVTLDNDHLASLLEDDRVDFGVHIECPATSFRQLIRFSDEIYEYEVETGKLNGKIQICPFILAKSEIYDYSNPAFNSSYQGLSFEIEPNNILAIGAPSDVPLEKDYDEIKNVNSIFVVVPIHDEMMKTMQISLDQDVIYVRLPSKYFDSYKFIRHSPEHMKMIHSLFIIPILVTVFEKFAYGGEDVMTDYEDYLWFKSLKRAVEKVGYSLDAESLQKQDRLFLAQLLTDNPILVSIQEMFETNIRGLNDED